MNTQRRSGPTAPPLNRSGSVLVEFAFIALAFYLLFAGTIELGRMITTAQAAQNAARVGARELALIALPPTMTFRQALNDPEVKARVYDANLLAVQAPGGVLPDTNDWPVINRMLTPLMIMENLGGMPFYHYPGAVISTDNGQYSVKVPVIVNRDSNGTETISFHDVIEEVVDNNGNGPFSLAASAGVYRERGLVALRVNCPYQAATLSAYKVEDGGPTTQVIAANDNAVQVVDSGNGAVSSTGLHFIGSDVDSGPDTGIGPYTGKYGLGNLYAMGTKVRPFRRMISAQSLFRREVYR